ncbi:hypothetical protein QUF73_24900 [Cytobacillus sp. NJ13]|nr:hypothetical protein [Cytobacillus sp. NJ13]
MATSDKTLQLMKQTFNEWNALKRWATLEDIEREKGNYDQARTMEINKLKYMGRIELSLRALQSELRYGQELEEQAN